MAGIDSDTSIDADAIRRDAEQVAGVADWDDSEVVEPLGVLTDSLAAEADLHAAGRAAAGSRLRDLLAGYIRMQGDDRSYPAIHDEKIEAPIVIFGLPRCGTTLLHGLMSADPRHRAPVFWESILPSPPPDADNYDTDPRRAKVQQMFDDMIERSPSLLASLPYSADLKAECNTMTQPTLRSVAFSAYYNAPTYQSWYLGADHRSMYAYHRRALQQLQWRGPKGQWVLKAPPHLLTMNELIAEYPDARLVQNHRDPKSVMASNCGLYLANRVIYTDNADPRRLGADALELWATGCERADAFRAAHPEVPVFDVYYEELVVDPLAMVERIYDAVGVEMTADARTAMDEWMVENARDKRPVEHYQLETFGLSPEQVDERFHSYRTNHGLG